MTEENTTWMDKIKDLTENVQKEENRNIVIASALTASVVTGYALYKVFRKKWTVKNIPDLSGRVYIVTGSSSGIGMSTVKYLAQAGATVVMAVRDLNKTNSVVKSIKKVVPDADLVVMELNLSSLKSVRKFAEDYHEKYEKLDGLINNAGIGGVEKYTETADGFETQFGVNHLAHFALTGLLLDLLIATPGSRVVNVSSSLHRSATEQNIEDWDGKDYNAISAYARSKAANILFTLALQRKFEEATLDVTATCCHPGWTATGLQSGDHINPTVAKFLYVGNKIFAQSLDMGCLPTLFALVAAEPGQFIGPDGFRQMSGYPIVELPQPLVLDTNLQERCWDISVSHTNTVYNFSK